MERGQNTSRREGAERWVQPGGGGTGRGEGRLSKERGHIRKHAANGGKGGGRRLGTHPITIVLT